MEQKTGECPSKSGDCAKAAGDCHKAAGCEKTAECKTECPAQTAHTGHPALSAEAVCAMRQQFVRSEIQGAASAMSCPCPNAIHDHVAKFYTCHGSFRAGNNPVAVGHTAIEAAYNMWKGLGANFDFHADESSINSLGGSRYVAQTHACVIVNRKDGTKKHTGAAFLAIYDVSGCPMTGFKLASTRVYIDGSPFFAANGLVQDSDADGNVSIHPK